MYGIAYDGRTDSVVRYASAADAERAISEMLEETFDYSDDPEAVAAWSAEEARYSVFAV